MTGHWQLANQLNVIVAGTLRNSRITKPRYLSILQHRAAVANLTIDLCRYRYYIIKRTYTLSAPHKGHPRDPRAGSELASGIKQLRSRDMTRPMVMLTLGQVSSVLKFHGATATRDRKLREAQKVIELGLLAQVSSGSYFVWGDK